MQRPTDASDYSRRLLGELPRFAVWLAAGTVVALYDNLTTEQYAVTLALYSAVWLFASYLRGRP